MRGFFIIIIIQNVYDVPEKRKVRKYTNRRTAAVTAPEDIGFEFIYLFRKWNTRDRIIFK